MGLLFSKHKQETGRLHYILKMAFERVKSDIQNIFHWINYLHDKHKLHDERLAKIEEKLQQTPTSHEHMRQIANFYSPSNEMIDRLRGRIEELHIRINNMEAQRPTAKVALKERLMKKISKNSKEYIKSVILGTIKKYGRIQGPQLKEIIVEEQGICSKSSFYRLLQEIEIEQEISSFTQGKEKTYFLKTQILK